MSEHKATTKDQKVRGNPGTVASCICGWESAWGSRDGSAEWAAAGHVEAMQSKNDE